MEENNKPTTSEEFNKQLREEKGLPEKKPVETKTNAVTVLMIVIFILSLVAGLTLIILAAVTVINKTNENKESNTEEKDKKTETKKIIELKEDDIKDYKNVIEYVLKVRNDKTELSIKDMSNQELLKYGISFTKDNDGKYAKNDMKETITKAFGNVEYKDENILCFVEKTPLYEYDSSKEEYSFTTKYNHGHGGEGDFDKYYFFQSAEKDEDNGTITIRYKIIYGLYQSDISTPELDLFLNAKDSYDRKNQIYDMDDNNPIEEDDKRQEVINKTYEEYKDKLPVTTFIFEKDSTGNYGFKSVESK